jgi:hypothetical protein
MAGRDKDFAFIKELLDRGLINIGTFIERAALVVEMPQSNALLSRIERFETYLKDAHSTLDSRPFKQLAERLRTRS